jgi:Kinesin motor domain
MILFSYKIQLKFNHFSNYYYYTVNDVNTPASPVSELRLGKMHLVDLAGSERVALSGAEGDTLLETQSINLSLTAIGRLKLFLSSHHYRKI